LKKEEEKKESVGGLVLQIQGKRKKKGQTPRRLKSEELRSNSKPELCLLWMHREAE
jgi:hypothetical protein